MIVRGRTNLATALLSAIFAPCATAQGPPTTTAVAEAPAAAANGKAGRPDALVLRRWWYAGEPPPGQAELLRLAAWVDAHQDDGELAFLLAMLHQRNVPAVDPRPAVVPPLVERAARLGYLPARARLGMMKLSGDGVPQDAAAGRKLLEEAAAAGDSDAPIYLAHAHLSGIGGFARSPQEALRSLERAQGSGNVHVHPVRAAALAQTGDTQAAARELEAGARAGDVDCRTVAGARLLLGEGVRQDVAEAGRILLAVAEAGSLEAQRLVGTIHRRGPGGSADPPGPADPAKAAWWFGMAARGGNVLAKRELVGMHLAGEGLPPDPPAAVRVLEDLARAKDPWGMLELGKLKLQGVWVERDPAAARRLFEAAAAAGSTAAAAYVRWLGPPAGGK